MQTLLISPRLFTPRFCSFLKQFVKNCSLVSPPPKQTVVTVLEACGRLGRHLALLLKQNPLIDELRLYDKNAAVSALAEDLSHMDTRTKIRSFGGITALKHAVTDADLVLSVGGCRNSYRETVEDSFEKNLDDVRSAALHLIEFNPKAVFGIAKPPVEAFVPLVSEEYKKGGVYDNRRIIGITTTGSMMANSHVAAFNNQNPAEVLCPILGGLSPETLIAVLSQSRPKGHSLPKALQKAISNCENDILKLYADSNAICLMPALAISRFVNTALKALKGETNCIDCAFIRQTGHIGHFLPYMTSIVRFGRNGVFSSHMPKVSGEEAYLLKRASFKIRQYIRMGEEFSTGQTSVHEEREPLKKPIHKTQPENNTLNLV